MINVSSWRWPQWMIVVIGLLWLVAYFGALGPLRANVEHLGRHPSVADWFNDPLSSRRDALLVLFAFGLTAPIVSMVVAGMLFVVLGVMAIPVGRLIGSQRASTLLLLAALVAFLYVKSPIWGPWILPLLAVVARAYLVAQF